MSYGKETTSNPPFRWHYSEFDESNFQIRGRTLFFLIVLFSVILLVALLLLYARWVCRFAAAPPPPQPPPPPRRGLDDGAISRLPIVLHKINNIDHQSSCNSNSSDQTAAAECCICLGVFDDGDKVKVLPQCGHCFHSECVDTWLTAQSSCPMCRAAVMVDPPV